MEAQIQEKHMQTEWSQINLLLLFTFYNTLLIDDLDGLDQIANWKIPFKKFTLKKFNCNMFDLEIYGCHNIITKHWFLRYHVQMNQP